MHPILRDLHQDHLNLARILRLLEAQLNLILNGESADLYVLGEIVDYIETYPDQFHHPREDIIFGVYRDRSARGIELIDRLLHEHRILLSRTLELRGFLDQWASDLPISREHVGQRIADYLSLQWQHLNLEEGSVFHLLEQELSEHDWERIEASMPEGSDPLFANLLRSRYENIFGQVFECA